MFLCDAAAAIAAAVAVARIKERMCTGRNGKVLHKIFNIANPFYDVMFLTNRIV